MAEPPVGPGSAERTDVGGGAALAARIVETRMAKRRSGRLPTVTDAARAQRGRLATPYAARRSRPAGTCSPTTADAAVRRAAAQHVDARPWLKPSTARGGVVDHDDAIGGACEVAGPELVTSDTRMAKPPAGRLADHADAAERSAAAHTSIPAWRSRPPEACRPEG